MALIYDAGTWGTEAGESANGKHMEGPECMGRGHNGRISPPLDKDSVPIKSSLSERLGFRRHQKTEALAKDQGEEKPKLWPRVLDLEV